MFADPYYTPSSDIGGTFFLEVPFICAFEFRELDLKPPKLRSCPRSPIDVPLLFTQARYQLSVVSAKVLAMVRLPFLVFRP